MRLLITGAAGMLGRAVVARARVGERALAWDVVACTRAQLDVTAAAAVRATIARVRPAAVVQCAAYTRVDDAEREADVAVRTNAVATEHVARACRAVGARLVYPSTDYVFDGSATAPIPPDAPVAPLNAYGRSKLAGEAAAGAAGDTLVVRTSWLYGPGGRNFVSTVLERAREGQPLRVVDDQHGAPTYTEDLADMLLLLLERAAPGGTYHATNTGATTWYGLATAALARAGLDADIVAVRSAAFPQTARRPAYSVLDCRGTYAITGAAPCWRNALARAIESELDA